MNNRRAGNMGFERFSAYFALLALILQASIGSTLASAQTVTEPNTVSERPLDPQSPWPKFRHDAAQTGRSSIKPCSGCGTFWRFKTGKGIFSSPVVDGKGNVYVGSADGNFYVIGADGSELWSYATAGIFDSSALLDDRGLVYAPAGDGHLYAFNTQVSPNQLAWKFAADAPTQTGGFLNWFEGNVAIGADGILIAPNDGFRIYGVDRNGGTRKWEMRTCDQTWSLPATDGSRMLFGNNFMGGTPNVFAYSPDKTKLLNCPAIAGHTTQYSTFDAAGWSDDVPGSVVASPLLLRGRAFIGAFDGKLHVYDVASGKKLWAYQTRDHIYSSPAQLSDGTIVQPSTDGSIYALSPDGKLIAQFDTIAPIRSSPAVDGNDNIYVGTGDGRLLVLALDKNKSSLQLRWAMQLAEGERGTLNSSPALSNNSIVIGDSNGYIYNVPYEYCLGAGKSDKRCQPSPNATLPRDALTLLLTTPYGLEQLATDARVAPDQPIALSLFAREQGRTKAASILPDAKAIRVWTVPVSTVSTKVSGDGRYLIVFPPPQGFNADSAGGMQLNVNAPSIVEGLKKNAYAKLNLHLSSSPPRELVIPRDNGKGSVWLYSRLALSLPSLMPSYNQIGFESLNYQMGMIGSGGPAANPVAIAWMIGMKTVPTSDGKGVRIVPDPNANVRVPFVVRASSKQLDFEIDQAIEQLNGFRTKVTDWKIAAYPERSSSPLGNVTFPPGSAVSTQTIACKDIQFYGQFFELLSACFQGPMQIYGGAQFQRYGDGTQGMPQGVGQVIFGNDGTRVTASVFGSTLKTAEHVFSLLLVDAHTGMPLSLDYSYSTQVYADGVGNLRSISIPIGKDTKSFVAYLIVDTYPVATSSMKQSAKQ